MTDTLTSERLLLEGAIRAMAAAFYLATAIIVIRLRPSAARSSGAAAYVSKAAHAFSQFPPLAAYLGGAAWALTIPATMGAALTWLFAVEFFGDDQKFDPRRLLPVGLVAVIAVIAILSPPDVARVLWLLHTFISVALMTHVIAILFRRWQGDLVERRRLIVTPLFVIAAAYSVGVGFVQTSEAFAQIPRQPSLIAAVILLLSSILAVIVFGQAGPSLFGEEPKLAKLRSTQSAAGSTELSASGQALASELDRVMRTERLYRTQNLRISSLALAVRTPEHRLRQLLNHDLGFRNFNAFLAQWRIAEAKDALADPEQVEVPISTIAIDSGFQSLAPFNRAFKAETGMTPSEYRASQISAAAVTPDAAPLREAS